MEEQPWTKVRDEETGQWAWFHPERGERIAISAEDEEDATCFAHTMAWAHGTNSAGARPPPLLPVPPEERGAEVGAAAGHGNSSASAHVGAMASAALCTWLGAAGASAECCAAVQRRGLDGRALLTAAADPFTDGLSELGMREPLLRGKVLEAAALSARRAAVGAAAEWDAAARNAAAGQRGSEAARAGTHATAAATTAAPAAGVQLTLEAAKARRARRGCAEVQVGYKVSALGEVDCLRAVFFAHFKLFATWLEPELAGCSLREAERLHTRATQDKMASWEREHGLLQPELVVLNAHDLECTFYEMKVADRAGGAVKWSKHFRGWLDLEIGFSLENFPFDYHDLRICVRSRALDQRRCSLRLWRGVHSTEFQEDSNEWQLVGHRADGLETDPSASPTGKIYEELHVCIMVRRHWGWYLSNVFVFLFALVLMSVGVYAMPFAGSEAVGGRTAVCVSLIFAVIALKFVVAEHIPRVHYSTFFDEYVIMCFVFVTASGVQSLIMYKLSDAGTADRPRQPMFSEAVNKFNNVATSCAASGLFILYHMWTRQRLKRHRARMRVWRATRLVDERNPSTAKDDAVRRELSPDGSLRRLRSQEEG
jgi:hypothetical protein